MSLTTNRSMTGVRSVAGAGITLLVCASALAAQASPLVCSIKQASECDESLGCETFAPEDAVSFLHVDVARNTVTILAPSERRGEVTEIQNSQSMDGLTVLTGTQLGRGWSMAIDNNDGVMTLTISDKHVGFVVFGRCIASDLLSP